MRKSIYLLTALVAMVFFGCQESANIPSPGDNAMTLNDTLPVFVPDTDGVVVSVDSAIAICKSLAADQVTDVIYKISGSVTANVTAPEDAPKYRNITFKLSDNGGQTNISCYYTNNINNTKFRDMMDVPLVGSKLTVRGPLTNYKGTTPEMKEGFIVRIDSMVRPVIPDTFYIMCDQTPVVASQLPIGGTSTDAFIVSGYVQAQGYSDVINKGQQTFWMDDQPNGKKVFEAFWCTVPNGEPVPVGAKVEVTGHITNYNGNVPEIKNGTVKIVSLPE